MDNQIKFLGKTFNIMTGGMAEASMFFAGVRIAGVNAESQTILLDKYFFMLKPKTQNFILWHEFMHTVDGGVPGKRSIKEEIRCDFVAMKYIEATKKELWSYYKDFIRVAIKSKIPYLCVAEIYIRYLVVKYLY